MASGIFTTSDLETIKEAIINLSSGNAQLLQINGRMWRTAGQCFQESRKVSISPKFYDAGFDARMNQVILPHELIHQADYDLFGQSEKKCGHGKNWSMLMVQYGLEPDKYHTMQITQQGTKKND
jgi:predicted SprT family Zn-dependent metalloprotease